MPPFIYRLHELNFLHMQYIRIAYGLKAFLHFVKKNWHSASQHFLAHAVWSYRPWDVNFATLISLRKLAYWLTNVKVVRYLLTCFVTKRCQNPRSALVPSTIALQPFSFRQLKTSLMFSSKELIVFINGFGDLSVYFRLWLI